MTHRDFIGIAALTVFVGLAMLLILEHQYLNDLKTEDGHKILPPEKPKGIRYQVNTPIAAQAREWKTIDGESIH